MRTASPSINDFRVKAGQCGQSRITRAPNPATRIRQGLSQAQLALPELSDSYVSLIESGKRMPTPDVVRLLARKLGCSASYLSSGIDEDAQDQMRVTLEYAEIALQNGEATEARDRLTELLADPDLASLPDYARRARWGHALALESTGDLEGALREFARAGRRAVARTTTPRNGSGSTSRCPAATGRRATPPRASPVAEGAFARVTAQAGPVERRDRQARRDARRRLPRTRRPGQRTPARRPPDRARGRSSAARSPGWRRTGRRPSWPATRPTSRRP